jgi:hypothetical protein
MQAEETCCKVKNIFLVPRSFQNALAVFIFVSYIVAVCLTPRRSASRGEQARKQTKSGDKENENPSREIIFRGCGEEKNKKEYK